MGTPEDVIGNSVAYFRTYFFGSIAVVMYNVGASILQSVGNSRSPMKYLITASLINICLLYTSPSDEGLVYRGPC